MNIKQKLYLLGGIAILGVLSLVFVTSQFAKTTNELVQASTLVDKLEIRLLNLRRNEKDFLLRQNAKYLDTFKANSEQFLSMQSQLATLLKQHKLGSSDDLRKDLLLYRDAFEQLVDAYLILGLDPNSGLWKNYNAQLLQATKGANAETLLRLDKLDQAVKNGKLSDTSALGTYPKLLQSAQLIAAQKNRIGLAYNEGELGVTRERSHNVEEQFKNFSKALNKEIARMQRELGLIKQAVTVIVILVILGFIWQISRGINKQVHQLLTVMQTIANSNNIGLRTQVKGKDELSAISTYFNQLLDKFEQLICGTQSKSAQLTRSTTNMHDELQAAIGQFHVQAEHTTTMATSVQQMVATIGEISESTNIAVDGVQQAANNAEGGRQVVETTSSGINLLSNKLQSSQQSIASLNEYVEKIGGAVTMIQDIAEQTNLLALNAAIEAARAGEQGRGFAVVADEVRSLATRTRQSTGEITSVVSAIQSQMDRVISDIKQCTAQGQQTQQSSQQLDERLRKIIDDMSSIQSNSERIASAIEEQGIVMGQVSNSITELNSISENNMQTAQAVLSEVGSVSEQANQMDKAVSQFQTRQS
ncbi:methyl-accepting chemotaxis protein [Celerinatantimonas sp. MCCC 1A17872]|uniref:methyl-accepting chemotaxis protein n=1 Tax=Celerinatantimonas sp. MCCC 1A17872 TaxID=3177514 RepID=UPI0038C3D023